MGCFLRVHDPSLIHATFHLNALVSLTHLYLEHLFILLGPVLGIIGIHLGGKSLQYLWRPTQYLFGLRDVKHTDLKQSSAKYVFAP